MLFFLPSEFNTLASDQKVQKSLFYDYSTLDKWVFKMHIFI